MSGTENVSKRRVLLASLAGTTIEFFDFYIYATAAVLVFPQLFFPNADPTTATLQSFATFSIAFFARPIGAMLFGHFGDRIGRKATLVAALLTMGLATVIIGLLPTYETAGIWAPLLLAACRFFQGLGLGGEWGGAVLLATENAPKSQKTWFGMFPQLGAPIGFLCSTGIFLLLTEILTDQQFLSFGWRIPFIASASLVMVGLYVRLRITETPAFKHAIENDERVNVPLLSVFARHAWLLLLGTFAALATFVLFYLMTVFALSWGISGLGYTRQEFLPIQMIGVVFFGLTIPLSALLADRHGRLRVLLWATALIGAFGLLFEPLFGSGALGGRDRVHDRRPCLDGDDLWPAGRGAVGAVPGRRPLHGNVAGVQPRGHFRCFAGAIHRDDAGDEPWPSGSRLLPHRGRRPHVPGAAGAEPIRTSADAGAGGAARLIAALPSLAMGDQGRARGRSATSGLTGACGRSISAAVAALLSAPPIPGEKKPMPSDSSRLSVPSHRVVA